MTKPSVYSWSCACCLSRSARACRLDRSARIEPTGQLDGVNREWGGSVADDSQPIAVQGLNGMRTLPLDQSVGMIPDGASLMIGGFMSVGTPERIVDEIVRQGKRDLTVIANDTAMPGKGIGKLVEAGSVRKAIVSHIGLNPETQRRMMGGELEVELVPQGTLIERIRAGGHGLGGVLTATGIGTPVEHGKPHIELAGITYLVETALQADFALV